MGTRESIDLSGIWEFQPLQEGQDPRRAEGPWHTMPVPSNWHLAGLPGYAGAVAFRRTFRAPSPGPGRAAYLLFHGVDYFADVWLNGAYLGHHEGYFQPFRFRVDDLLGEENELLVRVASPREEPRRAWPNRKRLIKGIFQHHDCRPGGWHLERGQDAPTGGIWNRVELLLLPTTHVLWLRLHPLGVGQEEATVVARACVLAPSRTEAEAELRLWPLSDPARALAQRRALFLQPGENVLHFTLSVPSPRLWWTWDQGQPELYRALITVRTSGGQEDTLEEQFGIRELRVGPDGAWSLNGRPFFPRGTNFIPTQWLGHYTPEDIARDVRLLREANVNAVRVHAHVNRRELYYALDEAGIVVWQDFPLQWGYEETDEMVAEAVRQVRDMVSHLYNHPCIVVWCCHNEPFPANRQRLDPALAQAVRQEDPSRQVEEASDFRHHPYPGWYYGSYREFSGLPGAPLVTEFGAQALPSEETLRQMMPAEDLWPPNWERWAYHNFQYFETFHVAGVQMGHSLQEFVANSQRYQARLIKYAVERYRLHRDRVKGLFQFMFVDPWPAITWSVVDWFRRPKEGYAVLRTVYQPVLPVVELEREVASPGRLIFFGVAVVNDLPQAFGGARLRLWVQGPAGYEAPIGQYLLDVAPHAVTRVPSPLPEGALVWRVPQDAPSGTYTLRVEVRDGAGGLLGSNWAELEVVSLPLPPEWHPFF